MKYKNSILSNYKEGSRKGNISLLKGKKDNYEICIDWDDPRYKSILLFSGKLKQCINYSMNRFGIKENFIKTIKP